MTSVPRADGAVSDRRALPASFRLAIVRHAQTTANAAGRFSGTTDVPLTEVGRAMADAIGANPALARVERVFCSPMTRAVHTAQAIAGRLGLPEPEALDGLRELDFGEWEGRPIAEVEPTPAYRRWREDPLLVAPPGGEAGVLLLGRAFAALCRALAACPNAAIVTHKSPARLLTALLTRCDLHRYRRLPGFDVSSATLLEVVDGRLATHRPANVDHLPLAWRSDPDRATALASTQPDFPPRPIPAPVPNRTT